MLPCSAASSSLFRPSTIVNLEQRALDGGGATIGALTASAESSFVSYEARDACELVSVDFGSGLLRLRRPLGAEEAAHESEPLADCTFIARAADAAAEQIATTRLIVRAPRAAAVALRFAHARYTGVVREQTARGTPVFLDANFTRPLLVGVEAAAAAAARAPFVVRYRLLAPQETFFVVDASTGGVRSLESIDRQTVCSRLPPLARLKQSTLSSALVVGNVRDRRERASNDCRRRAGANLYQRCSRQHSRAHIRTRRL